MHAFSGLIDTSERAADPSLRVRVYISEATIEVATLDGDSWVWDSTHARISRVKADRFRLDLGEEALFFLPDDPIAFTLKASIGTGEADAETEPKQGWLRRRLEEASAEAPVPEAPVYVPDFSEPTSRRRKRFSRRAHHAHIWEETVAAGVARRRCTDCGHVSIDLTKLTSSFGPKVRPADAVQPKTMSSGRTGAR